MSIASTKSWCLYVFCWSLSVASSAGVLNHWRFDEQVGTIAADTGGSEINNAVWGDSSGAELSFGQGLIGNAAILSGESGIDNVFNVGGIEADGITQLTYSVWVKPNLTQLDSGGSFQNKGILTAGDLTVQRSGGPTPGQFWGAT